MEKTNVFYLHTPPELQIGSICIGHRATIACQVVGEHIRFGYAICSKADNFSRQEGRKLAETRLEGGFGQIQFKNDWFEYFHTPEAALMEFASTLARSMRKNFEKYKRRVSSYNNSRVSS